MTWELINRIYDAIIGKVIVLFSVISILTIITPVKMIIEGINTSISLLGAIIITISYGIYKILIPSLIVFHKTSVEYTKSIIEQNKENILDNYIEFRVIERPENRKIIQKFTSGDPAFRGDEIKIANVIDDLELNRAVKRLSEVKYEVLNKESFWWRWAVTLMFAVGILMMYWPSIERIFTTLLGGLE